MPQKFAARPATLFGGDDWRRGDDTFAAGRGSDTIFDFIADAGSLDAINLSSNGFASAAAVPALISTSGTIDRPGELGTGDTMLLRNLLPG